MKRFIDDKIWVDPWFSKLSSDHKILWIYLFTNCSKIGIWEENTEEVEYRLKKKLDWKKTKEAFSGKIVFVENEWHLLNFISIQYPSLLIKHHSPLHISVFSELEKKGLKLQGNSLYIDYTNTIHSVQVEVKVKEKVEVKVREKKEFVPPIFDEFEKYCSENGYSNISKRAFDYYDKAGWIDKNGTKVNNWKQKLHGTWFRDDNKDKSDQPIRTRREDSNDL